jgi:uncharacterized protein with NAD-binding domain and iron-sulfur cluster
VPHRRPVKVAIIGGGCASVAAAFELTRPEHLGRYQVTIYQLGWRLGGKGASGRGPADRIEEHGFHVWLGFYENAFQLLRECYRELGRDPKTCRIADWRDAFSPESFIGVMDQNAKGEWIPWTVYFPPGEGLPGDPSNDHNPFSVSAYVLRTAALLRTLLTMLEFRGSTPQHREPSAATSALGGAEWIAQWSTRASQLVKFGMLGAVAGLTQVVGLLELTLRRGDAAPDNVILSLMEAMAAAVRTRFEAVIGEDDDLRRLWEITDMLLAFQLGALRFGLLSDPRGFDALNNYDTREWLVVNGASQKSVDSALMRGLYDLALAYEDGDFHRPRMSAGLGLRSCLRMFFTYRGALFWKMRAGMGDVVFAPFYEVLKRRGVAFRFFHRLENVKLADPSVLLASERPYIEALHFDVQAEVKGAREYEPLVEIRGLPCWPSEPDYAQLVDGDQFAAEGWQFESWWDRRKTSKRTLRVSKDFDFVILGVGLGAIPHLCREILARDARWREMVRKVKTVATQAFQVWMREDIETLGWQGSTATLAAFMQPFDTWADMCHLIPEETWPARPRASAYFCSVFMDPPLDASRNNRSYPAICREQVRRNAVAFLGESVHHLWPNAMRRPGEFRWDLLVDPRRHGRDCEPSTSDESAFDSQFWTANVNPSDRYVLSVPGSTDYRISPLDNTYDNLTIAGDWTSCGLNQGCVEAAIISGRLAAHAIAGSPALEDIVGYDHP